MTDQSTLLAEYIADASEQAFRELVGCYIDLVYSTALRLVNGDTHRAEDVTQIVFADLARLARSFSKGVMLGGWLHRRTYHVATTLMRNERRRQNRERHACEMNTLQNEPEAEFERIAPYLDEVINELDERERTAIILRFFERRDFRAIGAALGSNEDAAQKSVSRAVEKLRFIFKSRGVAISATLLASVLAANASHGAPAGLALTVASKSLASAATAGTASFLTTLTKTILMKKSAIIIMSLAFTAAIITGVIVTTSGQANGPVTEKKLNKGLLLHLTFDSDETGLNQITDTSGRNNTARASGVRWTPDGKKGGAYEFTADGDQIVVPNNKSLDPEQLTVSAWIKTTTGDHFWRRIFDKAYNQGYALSVAGDWQKNKWYGQVSMEIGPGDHAVLSKNRVDDGQWHHVAATFDGTNQLVYVDGKLCATSRWNAPRKTSPTDFNLVIGCNLSNISSKEDDLGVSFRGFIDEPMVWNRPLSENEIAFLYKSQGGIQAQQTAAN
jgi:RNA polymerase sigma factor (sigma-70 family)